MKRIALAVLTYVGAGVLGLVAAGAASLPFLDSGDFGIGLQAAIMAVVTGIHALVFVPFVIVAEVLARRVRGHAVLPLCALPAFCAIYAAAGFVLCPETWWAEEPFDLEPVHLAYLFGIALLSLGMGTVLMLLANRMFSDTAARTQGKAA